MKAAARISLAVGLVAAASVLSGCSTFGHIVTTQTRAQSCHEIEANMVTASDLVNSTAANFSTDPSGAAAALAKGTKKFSTAASHLTNPGVRKKATALAQSMTEFSNNLNAIVKDPTLVADPNEKAKFEQNLNVLSDRQDALESACT